MILFHLGNSGLSVVFVEMSWFASLLVLLCVKEQDAILLHSDFETKDDIRV